MKRATKTTYLKGVLELVGVTQAQLARDLETSRQQVSKWAVEGRQISPSWAKRMEPILGIEWSYLVEGLLPPDLQSGNSQDKLIQRQLLQLKDAWPSLTPDERVAISATVLNLAAPRRKSA